MRKPKSIIHLEGGISTARSLCRLNVADRLRDVLLETPELLVPTRYSPYDPKYIRFSINDDESYTNAVRSGVGGASFTLYYRGKLHGSIWVLASKPKQGRETEWSPPIRNSITLSLEYRSIVKYDLLSACCRLFEQLAEISRPYAAGFGLRTDFRNGDWYRDYEPESVEHNGVDVQIYSAANPELACLPISFTWQTYIGPEYVSPIGQEKLLALEVYKSWPDNRGGVWLQLTEHPEQMHIPEVKEEVTRKIQEIEKAGVPDSAPEIDFSELLADPDK